MPALRTLVSSGRPDQAKGHGEAGDPNVAITYEAGLFPDIDPGSRTAREAQGCEAVDAAELRRLVAEAVLRPWRGVGGQASGRVRALLGQLLMRLTAGLRSASVVETVALADIAHLKNRRSPARHLGLREHVSDMIRVVAGPLSHQRAADFTSAPQTCVPSPTADLDTSPPTVHGRVGQGGLRHFGRGWIVLQRSSPLSTCAGLLDACTSRMPLRRSPSMVSTSRAAGSAVGGPAWL
ncbi:hypothetical protein ACU686_11630 [Yinghuangia aomiensis]